MQDLSNVSPLNKLQGVKLKPPKPVTPKLPKPPKPFTLLKPLKTATPLTARTQ
ncbi:MAG: hypothetical protein QM775_31875 [Pirellulales bacterium]